MLKKKKKKVQNQNNPWKHNKLCSVCAWTVYPAAPHRTLDYLLSQAPLRRAADNSGASPNPTARHLHLLPIVLPSCPMWEHHPGCATEHL